MTDEEKKQEAIKWARSFIEEVVVPSDFMIERFVEVFGSRNLLDCSAKSHEIISNMLVLHSVNMLAERKESESEKSDQNINKKEVKADGITRH